MTKGSRRASRWLTLTAAVFALALAAPVVALGAEPTSGYNQTPTTPSSGTSPSKTTKPPAPKPAPAPAKETVPASTSVGAAKEAKTTTTTTLPFTGFDLRWSLAIGLLLMGAGFSIVAAQRRQRRRGQG
jgi:hypothetical protein